MHVWALGLSCETPAAPPDRAAGARTRQPENSKRAHLSAPALQTPPKFHEKDQKRGKNNKNCGGRGKKARNFGPPPFGPHPLGLHPSGPSLFLGLAPHPWGAPPFGTPPFGALGAPPRGPTLRGPHFFWVWPHHDTKKLDWPKLDWPKLALAKIGRAKTTKAKNGLAKIGLAKIGQIRMAKTGLAKVGLFRRNKQMVEMAGKTFQKLKGEVEEKGLKLLIIKGGQNGKSKLVKSCRYLEESFQDWSEKRMVTTTSVESLGVDLGTKTKQLGTKEKTRRKKCEVRFSLTRKNIIFEKSYMRIGREKVAEDRLGPCESVVRPSSWHDAYGEAPVEKTYGSSRKQNGIWELSKMATLVWAKGRRTREGQEVKGSRSSRFRRGGT